MKLPSFYGRFLVPNARKLPTRHVHFRNFAWQYPKPQLPGGPTPPGPIPSAAFGCAWGALSAVSPKPPTLKTKLYQWVELEVMTVGRLFQMVASVTESTLPLTRVKTSWCRGFFCWTVNGLDKLYKGKNICTCLLSSQISIVWWKFEILSRIVTKTWYKHYTPQEKWRF